MTRILFWLVAIAFCFAASGASAAQALLDAEQSRIEETTRALADINDAIESGSFSDVRAAERELRQMLTESRRREVLLRDELRRANERLDLLPPAPAEGVSEPASIARARETAQNDVDRVAAFVASINANIETERRLLAALSAERVKLLYRDLLERDMALYEPTLWARAWQGAQALATASAAYLKDWSGGVGLRDLVLLLGALALSFAMIGPVHRWLRATFVTRLRTGEPTWARRVAVAGVIMLARLIPGLIGGFLVYQAARLTGLLQPGGETIAFAAWFALAAYLLVEGFTSGLFSGGKVGWGLTASGAERGRQASAILLAIVTVIGLKSIVEATAGAAGVNEAFSYLSAGFCAVIVGLLVVLLCRRQLWVAAAAPREQAQSGLASAEEALLVDGETGQPASATRARGFFLRRSGRVAALALIGAAVAGYVPIADFIATRLYYAALILAVAWFLRESIREFFLFILRRMSSDDAREDDGKNVTRFWVGAGVDAAFLIALAPAVLVLIGFSWRSVRELAAQAFFGVRIGNITISPASIFFAIALFVIILVLTRAGQRALAKGPFAHSRIDPGVQNSLTTIVGYVGLVLAFVAGVSALGFNLSNLALIAGALSVGIGFGLQSIVNNFVSGLILLFERPIKVGDWIVTASGEGIVRKISVRSTEIETFDRSSIIVPNSELISSTVTNWTHKNAMGRVTVPVGVSYNSDPDLVKSILLKVAEENASVLSFPAPFVVWKDFGASSLDFELRCFLADISSGLSTRTELRFAIFKAFKEAGIEIPYPQQDLYVKEWPAAPKQQEAS